MEKYYPLPCNCCGECCKHVDKVPQLLGFDRGNGVCKFLSKENKCSIYKIRPNVCNGKYVYENYFQYMSVKDFHKMIHKICDMLKEGKDFERFHKD